MFMLFFFWATFLNAFGPCKGSKKVTSKMTINMFKFPIGSSSNIHDWVAPCLRLVENISILPNAIQVDWAFGFLGPFIYIYIYIYMCILKKCIYIYNISVRSNNAEIDQLKMTV